MLSKRLTKGLSWLTDNGPRKAKHYWGRAKEKANEDELFGFGLWATVAYFLGPVLLLIVFAKWPSGLNEWGDFLAGAFGPVAFLWLVIGYLQQGKELRNSSKALQRQADELNATVEQHREMVSLSREQVDFKQKQAAKESLPRLILRSVSGYVTNDILRTSHTTNYFNTEDYLSKQRDYFVFNFELENVGGVALNASAILYGESAWDMDNIDLESISNGSKVTFEMQTNHPDCLKTPSLILVIVMKTSDGIDSRAKFEFQIDALTCAELDKVTDLYYQTLVSGETVDPHKPSLEAEIKMDFKRFNLVLSEDTEEHEEMLLR